MSGVGRNGVGRNRVGRNGVGRNGRCPCGSGRKAKQCCGIARGPSDEALARAFLAGQAQRAARSLLGRSLDEIDELLHDVAFLPDLDVALHADLPRLFPPEVERLRAAIDADDGHECGEALPAALAVLDTWERRAALARSVLALRDEGRIDRHLAAAALVDLDSKASALLESAVVEALVVSVGAAPTPAGLVVAGAS